MTDRLLDLLAELDAEIKEAMSMGDLDAEEAVRLCNALPELRAFVGASDRAWGALKAALILLPGTDNEKLMADLGYDAARAALLARLEGKP